MTNCETATQTDRSQAQQFLPEDEREYINQIMAASERIDFGQFEANQECQGGTPCD